jgi:hypothetical protein
MWFFQPKTKATVSVLTTVLTGLFSSALITQITNKEGNLLWETIFRVWTFYAICFLVFVSIIYNISSAVEEINYRKKIDDNLINNFVEKEGLNTLASEINLAFKNGDKAMLNNLMEMKDIFTQNLGKK